jgi:hypothetical protein
LPFKEPPALPAPKDQPEQALPDDEDDPTMPALPGPVTDTGEEPVEEPVEEPGEEPAPQEDPVADADNAPLLFDPDTRNIQKLMVAYQNFVKEFYNKAYLSEQGELIKDFVRELKDQVTGELNRKAAFARAGVGKKPEMNLAEQEEEASPEGQENKEQAVFTKRLPNFKADTRTFYDDVVTSQKMLKIFSTAASQGKNIGDTYKKRLIRQITDLQDATGQLAIDIDKLLSEQGEEATIQEQTAAEQLNAAQEVEAAYDKIRELFDSIYQQLEKLRAEQQSAGPDPAPKQADAEKAKEEPKQADAEKAEKEPEVVAEFKNYKYKTKISLKDIQSAAKEIIGILDKVSPYFPNVKPFSGKVDFDKLEEEYAKAVSALDFTVSNLRTLNKDTVAKGTLVSLRRKLKTFSEELSRIFDINPKVPDAKPASKEEPAAEGDPEQQPGEKAEEEATDEEVQQFLADNKDFYELVLGTYLPALEEFNTGGSGLITERNNLRMKMKGIKTSGEFIKTMWPKFQQALKDSPNANEKEAAELEKLGNQLTTAVSSYLKEYEDLSDKSESGNLDQLKRSTRGNIEAIRKLQTEVKEHVDKYQGLFLVVRSLAIAKTIDEKKLEAQWEALMSAHSKKIPDSVQFIATQVAKQARDLKKQLDTLRTRMAPILKQGSTGFFRSAAIYAKKLGDFFDRAAKRSEQEPSKQQPTDDVTDSERQSVDERITEQEENSILRYLEIVREFRNLSAEFMSGYMGLKDFATTDDAKFKELGIDSQKMQEYYEDIAKQESQIKRLLKDNVKDIKAIQDHAKKNKGFILDHVNLFGLGDNAEKEAENAIKDEEGKDKPDSLDLGSSQIIEDEFRMGMNSLKELEKRLLDTDNTSDPINESMEKMREILEAAMDDIYNKLKTLKEAENERVFKDIDELRYHAVTMIQNLRSSFESAQKIPKAIMPFKRQYNRLRADIFGKKEKTIVDPDASTEFYPDEKDKKEDIDLKKFKELWTNNPKIVNHIKKGSPDGQAYTWAPSKFFSAFDFSSFGAFVKSVMKAEPKQGKGILNVFFGQLENPGDELKKDMADAGSDKTELDTKIKGGQRGDTIPPGDVSLNLDQTQIIQKAAKDGFDKAKQQSPNASQEELIKKAEEIAMSDEDIEKVGDELEKDLPKDVDSDDVIQNQVKKELDKIGVDVEPEEQSNIVQAIKAAIDEEAPEVPEEKAEEASENLAGEKDEISPLSPEEAQEAISTEIDEIAPELPPETKEKITTKVQQILTTPAKEPEEQPAVVQAIEAAIDEEVPQVPEEKAEEAATKLASDQEKIASVPAEESEKIIDDEIDKIVPEAEPETKEKIVNKVQQILKTKEPEITEPSARVNKRAAKKEFQKIRKNFNSFNVGNAIPVIRDLLKDQNVLYESFSRFDLADKLYKAKAVSAEQQDDVAKAIISWLSAHLKEQNFNLQVTGDESADKKEKPRKPEPKEIQKIISKIAPQVEPEKAKDAATGITDALDDPDVEEEDVSDQVTVEVEEAGLDVTPEQEEKIAKEVERIIYGQFGGVAQSQHQKTNVYAIKKLKGSLDSEIEKLQNDERYAADSMKIDKDKIIEILSTIFKKSGLTLREDEEPTRISFDEIKSELLKQGAIPNNKHIIRTIMRLIRREIGESGSAVKYTKKAKTESDVAEIFQQIVDGVF